MNVVTKLVVLGGLFGLVGCVSGPKPRDREAKASLQGKPSEKLVPVPVTRILPEDINEANANDKAMEQYKILTAELQSSKEPQVAERP